MRLLLTVSRVEGHLSKHLPALKTMESVMDLISLCTLAYLGNALDENTYKFPGNEWEMSKEQKMIWVEYDINGMKLMDRRRATYIRGIAREVITWFSENYEIRMKSGGKDSGKEGFTGDLVRKIISQQVGGALAYKKQGSGESGSNVIPWCNEDLLELQVEGCCNPEDPLRKWMVNGEGNEVGCRLRHPMPMSAFEVVSRGVKAETKGEWG